MRKFVVGDICGDLDLLKALMDRISPVAETDYFLFTGSYLGPGEDSKGVLDYLIDFKEKFKCNFLRGCYETIFQQVLSGFMGGQRDKTLEALWQSMQGDKVFKSYATPDGLKVVLGNGKIDYFSMPVTVPASHIQFLEKNLHLWYMDHDFPFVAFHAGPDTKKFTDPRPDHILLGETGWWDSKFELSGHNIVFGHVPFPEPFRKPGKRGVYLGAGQGGDKMCAWEASSDEFVVVGGTYGN